MNPSILTYDYLFTMFSKFGPLLKIKIPTDENGMKKRYAFINFEIQEDKNTCIQMMEGKEIVREVEDKKPERHEGKQQEVVDNKCVYFKGFPLDM